MQVWILYTKQKNGFQAVWSSSGEDVLAPGAGCAVPATSWMLTQRRMLAATRNYRSGRLSSGLLSISKLALVLKQFWRIGGFDCSAKMQEELVAMLRVGVGKERLKDRVHIFCLEVLKRMLLALSLV